MTKNIKCPCCGSVVDSESFFGEWECFGCNCIWDESKRQPTNTWVDCSERLPEENVEVLAYFSKLKIGEIIFKSGIEIAEFWNGEWYVGNNMRFRKATHWQPLPQPPKTESEV